MKLLGDKIAVKELPKGERKERGLYLPGDHIQNVFEAEITHVGHEVSEDALKVGTKVLVSIYESSPKIRHNDDELRIYDTEKVLAILTPT